MAKNFDVAMNRFPDNATSDATSIAIKDWLDGLEIGDTKTVYKVDIEHQSGFWVVIAVYEA